MWYYKQATGELLHETMLVGIGYSGNGAGKNNPKAEGQPGMGGPIPRGLWHIQGPPFNTTEDGPFCLRLTPDAATDTFGFAGFAVHGDSALHPGQGSRGCMVFARPIRVAIWESGDYDLTVL